MLHFHSHASTLPAQKHFLDSSVGPERCLQIDLQILKMALQSMQMVLLASQPKGKKILGAEVVEGRAAFKALQAALQSTLVALLTASQAFQAAIPGPSRENSFSQAQGL